MKYKKDLALKLLSDNYNKLGSPIAFANANLLYEYFKDYLSIKDIKAFLETVPTYTKQRRFINKFPRNYIFSTRPRYKLQADLKDIRNISKHNKNYKYILVLIDTFTRKVFAKLLKSKSENNVYDAFCELLEKTGHFNHLCTDKGKEFTNKRFKALLKKLKINHYHPVTLNHSAFAERVIQTILNLINKFIHNKKSKSFVHYFDDIVKTYNNKYHRIIGMSPNQAESGQYGDLLNINLRKYRNNIKRRNPSFNIGDFVRVKSPKTIFSKGYGQNTLEELFQIESINIKHKIPLYTIIDTNKKTIPRQFYSHELQKESIKKNKHE